MTVFAEPGVECSAPEVREAQRYLNRVLLSSTCPETGEWDRRTEEAVRRFQRESGLRPDGVLDTELLGAMARASRAERPTLQIEIRGRIYLFTDRDYAALVRRLGDLVQRRLLSAQMALSRARDMRETLAELNDRQYVVSYILERMSGAHLPPISEIRRAEQAIQAAERSLRSGDLSGFLTQVRPAERAIQTALQHVLEYRNAMEGSAETAVTGLEIVGGLAFGILGIIAVPVAASYGAGAVGASVIAAAGTEAVEAVANEVGRGLSDGEMDVPAAARAVLGRVVVSGAIGALTAGAVGDRVVAGVSAQVVRIGGSSGVLGLLRRNTAVRWVGNYLRRNGSAIFEGIIEDVIGQYRSNPRELTMERFCQIVARQVLTAGIMRRIEIVGGRNARRLLRRMRPATRDRLLGSLGGEEGETRLREILTDMLSDASGSAVESAYDRAFSTLSGDEDPRQIEEHVEDTLANDAAFLRELETAVEREGRRAGR